MDAGLVKRLVGMDVAQAGGMSLVPEPALHCAAAFRQTVVEAPLLEGQDVGTEAAVGGEACRIAGEGDAAEPAAQDFAEVRNEAGPVTLPFDLLSADEHSIAGRTRELRFDIDLLSDRSIAAVDWLAGQDALSGLALGPLAASSGAAVTLDSVAARLARD